MVWDRWIGESLQEKSFMLGLGAGALAVLVSLGWTESLAQVQPQELALAVVCSALAALASHFPIHINHSTKVSLGSIPLYLAAATLPAPLAVASVAAGALGADLLARKERGLYPYDLLADTARWMLGAFLASRITHGLPETNLNHDFLFIPAALCLYLIDSVTSARLISMAINEPFRTVFRSNLSESYPIEGFQYLSGILIALSINRPVWLLALVSTGTLAVYWNFKSLKEVRTSTRLKLEDIADGVDRRDHYTWGHSKRVAEYTHLILEQMEICGPEAEIICAAARLHDVGKTGVSDQVLNKPGRLTDSEWAEMQTHPAKGAELLAGYPDFGRGLAMVLYHHERWDGAGYPGQHKNYEIPFGARVIAVADSYDAMTSDRPYRKALSQAQAFQILLDGRGVQWDPAIVDAFLAALAAPQQKAAGSPTIVGDPAEAYEPVKTRAGEPLLAQTRWH